MPKLSILAGLLIATLSYGENMQKHLNDTRELIQAGKYQEALDRHIWFHDHALEHQPSMYGVRLSFALSSWKELADKYPPAMDKLKSVRDQKTKLIEDGQGNHSLFHDVSSINETLRETSKTVELFRILDQKYPSQAKECWNVANDSVIEAKAYDLARKYIGNPVREFTKVKEMYEHNKTLYKNPRIGGDHFKAYNENHFVEECLKVIEIALALDDKKAAGEIQTKALAILDDHRLQDALPKEDNKQDAQPSGPPNHRSPSAPVVGGR